MGCMADLLGLAPSPLRADLLPADQPQQRPLRVRALSTHVPLRAITLLGLFFVGWTVTLMLVAVLFPHTSGRIAPWLSLASTAVPALLSYVLTAAVVEARRPPYELAPRRAGGLLLGLLAGVVLLGLCLGLVTLLGGWHLGEMKPASQVAWNSILAVTGLQAAIVEELLFRGVIFRLVEQWLGTWGAVAVSAVVFGAAHLMTPGASPVTALAIALEAGALFGAVYAVTRSLWVVIGLHLGWNVVQALTTGIVSGGATHGWLGGGPRGAAWLSGGAYGIEASVVTTVLLTALGAVLLWLVWRRGLLVPPGWVRRRRLGLDDLTDDDL